MTKKVTKATKAKPVAKKEAEIVKAALKPVTKTSVKQAKKPTAVKKEVKKPMSTKPALKKTTIKEVKTVEVKPAKEVVGDNPSNKIEEYVYNTGTGFQKNIEANHIFCSDIWLRQS